jgi:hypothetical protein
MAQSVLGSLAEGTALQGTASGAQHQPDFSTKFKYRRINKTALWTA